MKSSRRLMALAVLFAASTSQAQCLSDAQVEDFVGKYFAKTAAVNPPASSEEDGACTRAKLNAVFSKRLGKVIGYKAGLTNPAVQKRFNYDKPVWGKLYEGMLLPSGATVDAGFGAKPLFEADMLVRVKSEAINQATTPMEVLAAIDQVIPFIELPDLMVESIPKLNGPAVAAINVGARLGGGKGSDILEHPLNAVVWLAQALAKEGLAMKPGELISLGSFSALLPPKPGLSASVSYEGLTGSAPVSVTFK